MTMAGERNPVQDKCGFQRRHIWLSVPWAATTLPSSAADATILLLQENMLRFQFRLSA